MPVTPHQAGQDAVDAAVGMRYAAPISNLERILKGLPDYRDAALKSIRDFETRGKGSINEAFDLAGRRMGENRERSANVLGQEVQNLGRVYQGTREVSEAARALATQRLADLGANIGAGGSAVGEVASPLEQAAQRMLEQAGMSEAGAVSGLQTWAAQQDALLGEAIATGDLERANEIAMFTSEVGQMLAKAENDYLTRESDLTNKLLDLLTERGQFAQSYSFDLDKQNWANALQAAQFNLSEQEALSAASARAAAQALNNAEFEFNMRKYADSQRDRDLEYATNLLRYQQAGTPEPEETTFLQDFIAAGYDPSLLPTILEAGTYEGVFDPANVAAFPYSGRELDGFELSTDGTTYGLTPEDYWNIANMLYTTGTQVRTNSLDTDEIARQILAQNTNPARGSRGAQPNL